MKNLFKLYNLIGVVLIILYLFYPEKLHILMFSALFFMKQDIQDIKESLENNTKEDDRKE